jgi:hypothetical protein
LKAQRKDLKANAQGNENPAQGNENKSQGNENGESRLFNMLCHILPRGGPLTLTFAAPGD